MNFLSVLYAKAGITVDGVTALNNTATALTPTTSDNSTKIATTAFVKNQNYYPYPTGTTAQYVRGDGSLATFPSVAAEAKTLITEVYNNTGATLTKGTVVYINGGQGNLPTVTKALANSDSTSAQTYGVVQTDITNMNNGFVVVIGSLMDLDTFAYTNGTILYLSPTTAGEWTSTKPYAPQHIVYIGIVVRQHPTQGVVEVRVQNGYEMDELHNVSAQSPANGDILQFNYSTQLWTKTTGNTTAIAEGTNLYFTDARARAAITLTTSGTSGAATYNPTTGVLNIPQYQAVLSNPITGIGSANYIARFTGTTTIENSTIYDNGTSVGIGTTTLGSEANLYLGAKSTNEGGQLVLQKGSAQTYATHLDSYADQFRILYGTNTGTLGVVLAVSMSTRQLILPAYTATTSFTGTAVGCLAFDSAGNIITIAVPSGGGVTSIIAGTGVSVSSSTGAVTISIGQSVATSATPTFNQIITTNNGGSNNIKLGDDTWIGDTNVSNTLGIVGQQNSDRAYISFGSDNTSSLGRIGTGALTWAGNVIYHAGNSNTITSLGTITSGVWNGTAITDTYIASAATWNAKQNAITLTTTGTSGAATLVGATLNIPQYQAALTNPITGTGTTNYLPKFTGSTALGNSSIFDNGTSVGIGTATPNASYKLDINGGVHISSGSFYRYATDVGIIGSGTSITGGLATQLGIRSSADILFATNGANERMRITSAGNIGIGTATPSASALLEVATTGGTTSTILISGTSGQAQLKLLAGSGASNRATRIDLFNGVASTTIARWTLINDYNQDGTNDFRFVSASATALTLTQAGNLGLGITPTTSASVKTIQFGAGAGFFTNNTNNTGFFHNVTLDASANFLYAVTGQQASYYRQINGAHNWFYAAAGTAGNAISFTQAMTLLANGNLLIGTTTDAGYKLDVKGTAANIFITQNTSSTSFNRSYFFNNNGIGTQFLNFGSAYAFGTEFGVGQNGSVLQSNTTSAFAIGTSTATPLYLGTNATERMRIFSNGNIGINTTTDAGYKLDVNGTAIVRGRISTTGGTSNDVYTQYTTIADITNTNDYVLRFNNNAGSQIGYIGIISSGGVFQYNNSNGHNFTGAATFSSSVTTGGNIILPDSQDISWGTGGYGAYKPTISATDGVGIKFYPDGQGSGNTFTINTNGTATFTSSVTATSFNGNATTATNISNTGTVTLATATESNSIYITQPSYTTDTPVKLLNFAWYSDVWQMGNIRTGGASSAGFGIYLSGTEKVRIGTDGRISQYAWTTTGRNYSNEWIEFPNYSGLYSPNNNAHFYPNNANYGGWRVEGTRNGWAGLEFAGLSNGNITLMIGTDSNLSGFHNNSIGWQQYWQGGNLYISKNLYGGGTMYLVLDAANYSSYALPLTGGTITGDLTVNNKVYVGTHGCYFEEVLIGSTYELRVVDSAGNMTVLS